MAQVLYRKYRPQSFAEIKGQDHVVPLLRQSVLMDKISHAYLFSGPRGCGKTTIARIMAKAVNCENFKKNGDVCNECEYCKSINSGNSVDIIEMDAASNRGIEEIRSLKDTVNFLPAFLKKKVYIIDEAHMLTKEAFNALLKTLEEPPEHVIFILATTESNKLPITILSRVTRFDFQFGTVNEVIEKLTYILEKEGIKMDDEALTLIFQYSGGSFRDAESLLGKILLTFQGEHKISLDEVRKALGVVSDQHITALLKFLQEGNIQESRLLLDKIFTTDSNPSLIIDQLLAKIKEELYKNLDNYPLLTKLNSIATTLIKVKSEMRDFSDKKIILEIGFIEICRNKSAELMTNVSKPVTPSLPKDGVAKEIKEEVKVAANIPVSTNSNAEADSSSFKDKLIELSKQTMPRLVPIIKGSLVLIDNGAITITNPYKFNMGYLNKREVIDHIRSICIQILNKELLVKYVIGEVAEQQVKQEQKPETENQMTEKKVITKPTVESEKKPEVKVIVDNTELVENILLS